jgi:hypothetical protein
MPTYRFSTLTSRLARILTILCCALHIAVAAEPPASPAPIAVRPPQPNAVTVDFGGGTVADFVTAASKSGGASFNLIGEKADLATTLPSFSLRDVEPSSVAGALNLLLSQKGLSITQTGGAFVLMRGNPQVARESAVFESFQLAPYLEKQSIDDIVGAIRTAWDLNPANKADALQLKYHPATSLLLVSGSRDAINTTVKVVAALKRAPAAKVAEDKELTAKAAPEAPLQKPNSAAEAALMKQWTSEIERRRLERGPGSQPPLPGAPAAPEKK